MYLHCSLSAPWEGIPRSTLPLRLLDTAFERALGGGQGMLWSVPARELWGHCGDLP